MINRHETTAKLEVDQSFNRRIQCFGQAVITKVVSQCAANVTLKVRYLCELDTVEIFACLLGEDRFHLCGNLLSLHRVDNASAEPLLPPSQTPGREKQIRIGHKGRVGIDVRGHIHTGCTNTVDQVESIDTLAMITDTSGFNMVNVDR